MTKASDDEKSDGLEIACIGKLYSGTWEKKYWSSSRGKDRFPYPIGYNALRTQHGITYKMEISEGLKGPLFMISSTDGNSCSGQTPDMAWTRFQKKSTSQVKLWRGKRFSCKIDGVEFFGFKNPFVQRLLRELMANVSESADPITPASISCSDVLEKTNQTQCEEAITKPDLLQHLAKPRVTRKRSRTDKGTSIKSTKAVGGTTINSENANNNSDAPNPTELSTACAVVDQHGSCSAARNSLVPMNLDSGDKDGVRPSSPHKNSDSHHLDDLAAKVDDLFLQKPTRHSDSDFIEQANYISKDNESLDRSMVVDFHEVKSKSGLGEGEEAFIPDSLQNINASEIRVPDIFDKPLESAGGVKDDVTSTQMTDSDTLISESHPDHDNNSLVAHTNSEKNDFDSVKSMMTVLLPRALPLLKTFSRKRKKKVKSSIRSLSDKKNTEKGIGIDVSPKDAEDDAKVNSSRRQMEHFPNTHSVSPNKVHIDASVPDTFDDNYIQCHLADQKALHADFAGPGPTSNAHSVAPNKVHIDAFIPDTFDDNDIGCHLTEQQALHADLAGPGPTSNAHSVAPNNVHTDAVIPDTFDDNDIECRLTEQQALHTDFAEPGPTSSIQGHFTDNSFKGAVNINAERGNQLCHAVAADLTMLESQDIRPDACSLDQKCNPSSPHNVSGVSGSQSLDLKDVCGLDINMNLQNMRASDFLEASSSHILNGVSLTNNIIKEALEAKGSAADSLTSHLHNQKECDTSEELKHVLEPQAMTYSNQHLKLIAGYAHPMPIKSVLLSKSQNEIYICALCGIPEDEEGVFFLYKAQMEGPDLGCPSFYGHSSIILPSSKDAFGRNITKEKSGLQFTPDARFLVLLNSIKTPYCSDSDLNCSCGSCKANSFENNAVKIVHVKGGFVTVVAKLKTTGAVNCILVCEPSTLVAAEESGKLYLWVMNSDWSAQAAEYLLPTPDCIPPCTLELKKIPKVASLIIGHNGVGDFCLWDIHKHILVSKISSPNTPVQQLIPVSLFRWRTKGRDFVNFNVNETIDEIMDATKTWMTEPNKNLADVSHDAEDLAIWLLIYGESGLEHMRGSNQDVDPTWRLGLLVKHTVITGSELDPRAAAVGASAGHGVIGRSDGLVYIWELSTGINMGNLHNFKGGRMSCMAIDDSGSDVFAIASNEGHLLVYKHS